MRSSFPYPLFRARARWCASTLPVLSLCALLWSMSSGAGAQQALDDDRARAHFFAGESHFAAERWADAEREFALAYELSRRPEMLINLSRAQERNGQLAEAIGSLELLVAKHPQNSYRGEAEARIASMRKQLTDRPPEPVVQAPPVEPAPAPAPVEPVVAPAPEPAPALPPVALEPQPAAAAHSSIWPPSLITSSIGGAALATAVVALGTGLRANHLYNRLDGRCDQGRCDAPFQSTRDHGQTLARTSTAFTFVSVALAGTAAVFWVYDVKKRDKPSAVALGIDGAGARMRAQF